MEEEITIEMINANTLESIHIFLTAFRDGSMVYEDILVASYSALAVAILVGYNPEEILEDAKTIAETIISQSKEEFTSATE